MPRTGVVLAGILGAALGFVAGILYVDWLLS